MQNTYTAVTKQDGNWWIGWVEEVPGVNCQERTKENLLESLRVTLKEALDGNTISKVAPNNRSKYSVNHVSFYSGGQACSARQEQSNLCNYSLV